MPCAGRLPTMKPAAALAATETSEDFVRVAKENGFEIQVEELAVVEDGESCRMPSWPAHPAATPSRGRIGSTATIPGPTSTAR